VDADATRRARQLNYELEQSVLADKRHAFGVEVSFRDEALVPHSKCHPPLCGQVEGNDVQQDEAAVDDYVSEWSVGVKAKLVEAVEQLAAGKVGVVYLGLYSPSCSTSLQQHCQASLDVFASCFDVFAMHAERRS
jgi:hypothetical protein